MARRSSSSTQASASFEAEVRANILARPLGSAAGGGTVADLDLAHEFLARVVDRVLRASFYERFRSIAGRPETNDPAAAAALPQATDDAPPPVASFRADAAEVPDENSPLAEWALAARRLSRRLLPRDGLLATAARVVASVGPDRVLESADPLELLRTCGIPVDLLETLRPHAGSGELPANAWIRSIATRLASGEPIDRIAKSLKPGRLNGHPSLPGFRPTSDSGRSEATAVRMHASRPAYFTGPGDGSNLDLVRGVIDALPKAEMLIAAASEHCDHLRTALPVGARPSTVRLLPQARPISQWAADCAKPGVLHGQPAHMLPRFASRGEYLAEFARGDDEATAASSIASARSPLLFQGGNTLIVDDVPRRRRVLLVGEAEVQRNREMGLTSEQVLALFAQEFGVEHCEVLPAASYHIDQEVSIRSGENDTCACVPDVDTASQLVIQAGVARVAEVGRWPAAPVSAALDALHGGRLAESVPLIWQLLVRERTPELAFPRALADALSTGDVDSGVGNLQRFLLAVDLLASRVIAPQQCPDQNLAALFRSLARQAADRRRIRFQLERLGWRVHAVPAIPEESRGINALNGVHVGNAYLMPSYGGLFAAVDAAAEAALRDAWGKSVEFRSIPSAESQRRHGGVHCSVAVYGQ